MLFTEAVIEMRELQINLQRLDGVEVVELSGAVDAISFAHLAPVLTRLIQDGGHRILLDCSLVTYIGSIELKHLLDFSRYARARGGDLKCIGVLPTIQQVANLIAQGEPLDCFEDLGEAVSSFAATAR